MKIISRGGAASQLLSVAALIYCKKRYNKDCEIIYEDHQMLHTKEFVLGDLLSKDEFLTIVDPPHRPPIPMGRILRKFPEPVQKLLLPVQSIYGALLFFRANVFSKLRISHSDEILKEETPGEIGILDKVSADTKLIDATFNAEYVFFTAQELSKRFDASGLTNPFHLSTFRPEVCVHMRLGDMRKIPRWVESHGVISPVSVGKVLRSEGIDPRSFQNIIVISDEPHVARNLLSEFGFSHWIVKEHGEVWDDVKLMASSDVFVGSFSTVSFVAAAIRRFNQMNPALLPRNSRRQRLHRKAINDYDKYFNAQYLPTTHRIYSFS